MSKLKNFERLLEEDGRLSDEQKMIVNEILLEATPEPKIPAETPHQEITEQMLLDARSELVKATTSGGVLWYLNPESKRWIKSKSPIGKYFRFFFEGRAETKASIEGEANEIKRDILEHLEKGKVSSAVNPSKIFIKQKPGAAFAVLNSN